MANVQRRPNFLPLLGLACLPFAASAAQLRVIGDSGTVESTVQLTSARYDVTQKKVVVTTRAGNTICSGGVAPAAGKLGLEVDGSSYGVADDPAGQLQDMPVDIAPGSAAYTLAVQGAAQCKSSGSTAANLKLAFEDGAPLTIGEAVYFDLATRTFDIRVTDPVLCNSYASGPGGLSIRLTEANGVAETIAGFDSVNYELGGALLRARAHVEGNGARMVQCFSFAAATGAPGASPSAGDSIFGARFEYDDVSSDLVVTANPASMAVLAEGTQGFQYTLTVANVGNGVATDVRVREYLPPLAAGTLASGAWSCNRYAGTDPTPLACGNMPANPTGVLNHVSGSLGIGERLVYTLDRSLSGAPAGTQLVLGGAAFVNPAPTLAEGRPERNYSDNSARVSIGLVANQPPTLAAPMVVAYEDGDAVEPQEIATASTAAISVPLSFTDADSPSLTVVSGTYKLGADAAAPLSALPALAAAGANVFTGTLEVPAPAKDRNGVMTVVLNVNDGSTTTARSFSFDVAARNDKPDFALSSSALTVPACSPAAPCEYSVNDFIASIVSGPADEAQAVEVVHNSVGRITCSSVPSGFFSGATGPVVFPTSGTYRLVVESIGSVSGTATCEVTLRETATPASSTTRSFTITYP